MSMEQDDDMAAPGEASIMVRQELPGGQTNLLRQAVPLYPVPRKEKVPKSHVVPPIQPTRWNMNQTLGHHAKFVLYIFSNIILVLY